MEEWSVSPKDAAKMIAFTLFVALLVALAVGGFIHIMNNQEISL